MLFFACLLSNILETKVHFCFIIENSVLSNVFISSKMQFGISSITKFFSKEKIDLKEQYKIKAFFRMGKSAYLMREFSKAVDHFNECLKLDSANYEARNGLENSLRRIQESKTGHYDLKRLFEQNQTGNLHMDIADFQSEQISIVDISTVSKVTKCALISYLTRNYSDWKIFF